MGEDIAAQEARELEQALALSLQEYKASQSPQQPQQNKQAKPSEPGPSQVKKNAAKPAAAGGGGGGRGRCRKLQRYAPTDDEVKACFKELVSGNRDRATINDLVENGKKLGLDIDTNKAVAMLEYLGEQGVTQGVGGGGITLQDFQAIARHFRVE